jgi:nitrogen fixation NifU-like protein
VTSSLYGELIADHARNPRNREPLDSPDAAHESVNPLCGDRVRIELRIRDGHVEALRFQADACMVSIASASILSEMVSGLSLGEARSLPDTSLLDALQTELRPSRVACALLPLQALHAALSEFRGHNT